MLRRLFSPRDLTFTLPGADHEPWQSETHGEYTPLRRMLVFMRPRQPFVTWVRSVNPLERDYTVAKARRDDSFAFLIPTSVYEHAEAEDFIARYWHHFFAQALEMVEQDTHAWPAQRTLTMFRHWFDIEFCPAVLDLGGYRPD